MFTQKVSDILSALLIFLFLYTGLSKLVEHARFISQLRESPWKLLADNSSWFTWALPIGEVLICILLIIPKYRKLGFWFSGLLLVAFEIYLTALVTSGKHLPCSCGGIIKYLTWTQHIFFNMAFLIISIWGIYTEKRLNKKDIPLNDFNISLAE
ncbi:Methylamine utilisation protein MauE [Chitinophaga costaii]|uniref:Methylamine utilisation protein MauE n=1 Tax=Chitinophaga costaii TaxID=1335309 RepID=A0A1C4DF78_9BACT|nr:MauE/DoxX family redox-associated membrane protein [Chitinophaga costaii]PUZ24597.1 hypothetical protein DCM91_11935 [Chitinophaga costaii]SCC29860.1 Methylamine utilisation protein MauE [Chitinophaga costaii]